MRTYKSYKLHDDLHSYIDCVWVETYFDQVEVAEIPQLIVPDNSVELIFSKEKIERRINSTGNYESHTTHVSGLKTKPQNIKMTASALLAVRFTPRGIYVFTGIPACEFVDQNIQPDQLFGSSIKELEDRLFQVDNTEDRLLILNHYFLARLKESQHNIDHHFECVLDDLDLGKGMARINSLADKFSISIKTIERKCKQYIGVSPKMYSRLVRLYHVLQMSHQNQKRSFTDLAFMYGFSDYMHLSKEVKQFTGLSPSEYFTVGRGIQQPIFSKVLT